MQGNNGCAAVEYVITPDYQIKDIRLVHATSKHFAREAMLSVRKWQWADLPQGIITEPVKTKNRFEYCVETSEGYCAESRLRQERQCSGEDVLFAVGYRVR